MLFSSISFIYFFMPLALFIYFISPGTYKNLSLLITSFIFLYLSDPKYFYILAYISVISYVGGRLLEENKKKYIFISAIILQVFVLIYFKYFDILASSFNLGWEVKNLILPLGISFYTFKSLAYTVDVYRGDYGAEKNMVKYFLYMAYYPVLVSGPIVRYGDFKPYLDEKDISRENIWEGIERFILGLGKKVILANNFSKLGEFKGLEQSTLMSWLMLVAFSLELYFDFSGYSDMALGLSSIMGIRLKKNFDFPFSSKSIGEFWRRWHMSLGSWFRDYIYIPLGGNRRGKARWTFNLLVVWLLTGIWHGTSPTYLVWGLFIFMGLVVEKSLGEERLDRLPRSLRNLLTCLFILISFNFFYSGSLAEAGDNLSRMFFIRGKAWGDLSIYQLKNNWLLLVISLILSRSSWIKLLESFRKNTIFDMTYNFILVLLLLIILYVSTMMMVNDSFNPFLYIKF